MLMVEGMNMKVMVVVDKFVSCVIVLLRKCIGLNVIGLCMVRMYIKFIV